jgi:Uncharacterized conserved protein
MVIMQIDCDFSICKVIDYSQVDIEKAYCFIGVTNEEKSLVCLTDYVPDNVIACKNGWRAFRIQGTLDFSLIGILSKISTLLAVNKIGIFAISTYNTDYIFTRKESFDKAIEVLSNAGYKVI